MINNILLQTLNNIDWRKIAEKINSFAYFNVTKETFLESPIVFTNENIEYHLLLQEKLIQKIEEGVDLYGVLFSDLKDTPENHHFISGVLKGVIGDFKQLNFIACLLENFFSLKQHAPTETEKEIILEKINQSQRLKSKLINPLRKFVSRDGHADLSKHPRLREKVLELNGIESKIRSQLQQILKDEDINKRLQFETYDIISERYVIPIRSDSYNANIGLIVSRSGAGHTLFVEPAQIREICNRRLKIVAEIDQIINQICIEFTKEIESNFQVIKEVYEYLLDMDYTLSQAQFAMSKIMIKPVLSTDSTVELKGFFHPLIENCRVNDIHITKNQHGLIISGPNTGGKTVAIKSIILCHIFIKLGFFIPAQAATLSIMNDIFYFDSDYQDLPEGLSSFAGETSAILEMLSDIQEHSLVAADEIFNSTSSDEASALAISIIDHLTTKKDTKVLISTHHQLLKTKMQENESFLSAHVGYDFDKNSPTYELITGTPGSSMALTIFEKLSQRFSIDNSILEDAKTILDQKYMTYERLLQDLSKKKSELQTILLENRSINNELKNQKKSMEGVLFLEKQKLFSEYKSKMDKELKKIKELKKSKDSVKKIQNDAHHLSRELESMNPEAKVESHQNLKKVQELLSGQIYFCTFLNKDCELLETNRNRATVKLSGKTIQVPKDSLFKSTSGKKKTQDVHVNVFKKTSVDITINGRGKRLNEFQNDVESGLESLLAGEIPYLLIVHGHGEGVLKNWLRKHLKNQKEFSWMPEEGNDGCTRVELNQ